MRNQSGRLVVIGDANPDIVLSGSDMTPAFGQAETLVDHAELSLGGSAAITAAAAAGMGVPTLLVAAVGRDTFGDIVTSQLAAAGVDTSALQRVAEPTGVTVVLSRGPDRAILTAPGAIGTLRAESVSDSDAARRRSARSCLLVLPPARARRGPYQLARRSARRGRNDVIGH